jgi:hypothetical protein
MLLHRMGLPFVISQIKLGIQLEKIGESLCLLQSFLLKIGNLSSTRRFIPPTLEVNPAEAIQLGL